MVLAEAAGQNRLKTMASITPEPVPTGSNDNDRRTVMGVSVLLALAVFLVFGQTLGHEFVNYDDNEYVYDNPAVTSGLNLEGVKWAFTHITVANWHPLTMMSHMLDCRLYGLNAGGHHLTSVLLHAASAILLFLVLRQMTGRLWRSAFVAAVFAIHPLRVESVAWVAERKDVLSGLFFILTIGAYVRYVRRPFSPGRYLLVMFLFALGLLSKPMGVTLPFVLLLLDYWPLKRFAQPTSAPVVTGNGVSVKNHPILWRLVIEKIPMLALTAAACVVTMVVQEPIIVPMPLALRISNALVSWMIYWGQMFWPVDLAVFYPYPQDGLPGWEITLAVVLLAVISAGAFLCRQSKPYLLIGWLWYLGMLVPAIGLVQSGLRAHADRYTYLPQIGSYLLLTWAAADLCAGWRHRRLVLGSLAAMMLAALGVGSFLQTSHWRNSESLWTHTIACTSANYIGHNNLGIALVQKGKADEAIVHYQKALQIEPDYAAAHVNLGIALAQEGNWDEAITHYQKALEINPDFAEAHYNLGNALLQTGKADEAIVQYQKALQINPGYAEVHYNLGNALLQTGKAGEAIVHYRTVLQIKPGNARAHYNFGIALLQAGKTDEAIVHYQKALQIEPDYAAAHINLGVALAQQGNWDEAIVHYQKALQRVPDFADVHCYLGNALVQKGRVREAIVHYQKALQIKPDDVDVLNNLAWLLATSPEASVRNGPRAVELARQAEQLTGGRAPRILDTLAAAYAAAGRFGEAGEVARRAINLAVARPDSGLAADIRSRLKLYETNCAYSEKP